LPASDADAPAIDGLHFEEHTMDTTGNDTRMKLWIARHGNRQDLVDPGWKLSAERPHDPPLSEDGFVQVRELADRLAGEDIRHLYASPFIRALQTATPVAEALDLPIRVEPGAAEWLNEDWFPDGVDTLPVEELARKFPRVDTAYEPLMPARFPESWEDCLRRCTLTGRKLAERHEGDVLVVGHGATIIGMVQGLMQDLSLALQWDLASLTLLERTPEGWELKMQSETSHLSSGAMDGRLV
jgi:broad specificity phosphatase PhoE